MPRGAAGASSALPRAIAPLALLLLALGATLGLPAHASRPAEPTAKRCAHRAGARLPAHATPSLTESHPGQPFVEAVEKELDEEGDRALEPPSRPVVLDDAEPSRARVERTDGRPACLIRLLALPIRGPPSA